MNFTRARLERPPDQAPRQLRARLAAAGYTEAWTTELARRVERLPARLMVSGLLKECMGSEGLMTRLWALSQWVEREPVEQILGSELVVELLEGGLLRHRRQELAAAVDLCPAGGMWLASDRQWGSTGFQADAVYPPGLDSLCMCRWTPRWPFQRALDLGTGSGIQALSLGATEAFDINPRAVEFARFNARLNDRELRVVQSDLYAEATGKYDLILSNPPWVPAPAGDIHLFRGGGVTGEELVERICRGLPEHLSEHGRAALYVEYPRFHDRPYLERVRAWLGPGRWGLALLHRQHYSLVEYVAGHTAGHFQPEIDFERWYASYQEQGIAGVSAGLLLVARGHDYTVERDGIFPTHNQAEAVQAWVESLEGRPARAMPFKLKLETPLFAPAEVLSGSTAKWAP